MLGVSRDESEIISSCMTAYTLGEEVSRREYKKGLNRWSFIPFFCCMQEGFPSAMLRKYKYLILES
jgi:hypothetical protein